MLLNNQAKQIFTQFLKKGKNRITTERYEVLDAVINFKGHFGADDLYVEMKNNNSSVSRATVYNTIDLLEQSDIITKRNFGENSHKYECTFKQQRHDHIICLDCGKIIEFTNQKLKLLPEEICLEKGIEYFSHSLNIYGKCKECKKNGN